MSSLHIDLFCDDPKSAEIALINQRVNYDVSSTASRHVHGEPASVLSFSWPCAELGEPATLHLAVRDLDELRGALKPDAQGRTQRGDTTALARLLET